MAYSLGAVRPHVQAAADRIGAMFSVKTILGWGLRARESDHPKGLALDFMVGNNTAQGNAIAGHVSANAGAYGVKYYIWQQHIYNFSQDGKPSGDHPMEDRGSATENHMDHVHVSFYSTPGSGQYVNAPASGNSVNRAGGGCRGKAATGAFALILSCASIVDLVIHILGG